MNTSMAAQLRLLDERITMYHRRAVMSSTLGYMALMGGAIILISTYAILGTFNGLSLVGFLLLVLGGILNGVSRSAGISALIASQEYQSLELRRDLQETDE